MANNLVYLYSDTGSVPNCSFPSEGYSSIIALVVVVDVSMDNSLDLVAGKEVISVLVRVLIIMFVIIIDEVEFSLVVLIFTSLTCFELR